MSADKRSFKKRTVALSVSLCLLISFPVHAWTNKTHLAIAYLAYRNLDRHAKERVNEILVMHPLYKEWTRQVNIGRRGLVAFMNAATWPDCIQTAQCPGYVLDGDDQGLSPRPGQESWQNIGYSDRSMHKYWHFIQVPYFTGAVPPNVEVVQPNVATQLRILIETLSSNADDRLKSYDLSWLSNLVGEIHQPLNCISRFSARHPSGDRNGRDVNLAAATGQSNLHDYWDNALGNEDDQDLVLKLGKELTRIPDEDVYWHNLDIDKWVARGVELGKTHVYTQAVVSADDRGDPVSLGPEYLKDASEVSRKQAAIAGYRLAAILNKYLK